MEKIHRFLQPLEDWLYFPIFKIGDTQLTLWTIVYFLLLLVVLFAVAGRLRKILVERILIRTNLDAGARAAVGSITRYLVLLVGLLVVLQTVGIDLTTLNVIAGAVGIGVGFGLQNIASNFISGIIILFERPVKVGDRIEVGDVNGDVIEIGARATTVSTNDNIAIIIPNSKFITENVINWKHNDDKVRFRIPVGVAYGSDVRKVERVLLEVAAENESVLTQPAPSVLFTGFGDSSLNFSLLVWTRSMVHRRGSLISALNFAIDEKFRQHGIEIPFPQRDLHIRSSLPFNQ
ncbi:MAG: mechanosensitive ion channel [Blastocatellales bacterium]|nr:mechanosensitive ion channel [Blastocatellales bacterium]